MPTAIVFPGQGSQTPDMRERVAAARPDLLAAVGDEPFERTGESTVFAQPAIFAAALAGLQDVEAEPAAYAGHSLGELTAFVAAGAIDEGDGLRLVRLRARLMADADHRGGMLAVLGGDRPAVEAAARRHGVAVANDNAPGQVVLSGDRDALARAAEDLDCRTLPLPVRGAFHSPAMAPAVAPFADALAGTPVVPPAVLVFSCVTAAPVEEPDDVRRVLAEGLTRPVRWRRTVTAMRDAGVDDFVETGPGRVLASLIRRIPKGARA